MEGAGCGPPDYGIGEGLWVNTNMNLQYCVVGGQCWWIQGWPVTVGINILSSDLYVNLITCHPKHATP